MSDIKHIKRNLERALTEVRGRALQVLSVEAVKSIKKNFSAKGRPTKWEPRKRVSKKQRGTNLMVISGNLSNVSAETDIANNKVTLKTNPLARNYARIHNEGGVINMPPRKTRHRKTNSGRTVFASKKHKRYKEPSSKGYKIKMPKREFMVIPPEDYQPILRKISASLKI